MELLPETPYGPRATLQSEGSLCRIYPNISCWSDLEFFEGLVVIPRAASRHDVNNGFSVGREPAVRPTASSIKFHIAYASWINRSGSVRMVLLRRVFMIHATQANMPSERTRRSRTFVRRLSCNRHSRGNGKSANEKSVTMLITK